MCFRGKKISWETQLWRQFGMLCAKEWSADDNSGPISDLHHIPVSTKYEYKQVLNSESTSNLNKYCYTVTCP